MHLWAHPPLSVAHSLMPHLFAGSSSPSGQSLRLSHTLARAIHCPPPQSNWVAESQTVCLRMPRISNIFIDAFFCLIKKPYGRKLTTIKLITFIGTIELTIASQMPGYARMIVTLELIWATGLILTITLNLIITIGAIKFSVTQPTGVKTGNAIFTLILTG